MAPPQSPTEGRYEQASQLARGLTSLELVANGTNRISDIARALRVHRSTALRLLRQLEDLGYVRRSGDSARFELVVERLAWMATALGDAECIDVYRPVLQEVRNRTGEASVLAMPASGVMIYVSFFPSRSSVGVQERPGTIRPVHASAVGKAWLSGLTPAHREAEVAHLDFSGGTSRAVATAEELLAQVEKARARGWALDLEETSQGVACVAVPAWFRSTLVGAVAVSAPTNRVTRAELDEFGKMLLDVTHRVSGTARASAGSSLSG